MTQPAFNQRTISNAETLGRKLQRVREQSRLTIAQVADRLRIRPEYIEAIEQSKYTALPSGVFVKNYVQRYAKLLGVSWATVAPLVEAELAVYTPTPHIPTLKQYLTRQPLRLMQVVGALVMVFVLLGVGVYFGLELTHIIEPPALTVANLPATVSVDQRIVTITGQTAPEAVVSINDQTVPVAPDGAFTQQIALQPGSNILKIESKTKRSKPNTQYYQIYVEENL